MAQLPKTIQVDVRYKELMNDTKVIVNFTDWKQFNFRVKIAQFLMGLAVWVLNSTYEVEK